MPSIIIKDVTIKMVIRSIIKVGIAIRIIVIVTLLIINHLLIVVVDKMLMAMVSGIAKLVMVRM